MTVSGRENASEDDQDPGRQEKTDDDTEMDDPINTGEGSVGKNNKEGNVEAVDEDQDELDEDDVAPMVTRSRSRRGHSPPRPALSAGRGQPKQAQPKGAQSEEKLLNFEGAQRVRTHTLTRTTN